MIKLFRFLKPYSIPIVLVFVLTFVQSFASLFLPTLMAEIVDTAIVRNDIGSMSRIGALMLVVAVVGMLAAMASTFFSARTAAGFGRLIRSKLFAHIQQFSSYEYDSIGTASLITRTTNDTNQIQQVLIILLNMAISAPLMGIGGIVLAVSLDRGLSWILVVVVPILALAFVVIMRQGVSLFRSVQVKLDKLNLLLDEWLRGVRVIRAFDRARREQQRFDEANRDLMQTVIRANQNIAALMPVVMLVMNLAGVAVIWFGGMRINNGDLQVGLMLAFLQYTMNLLFALMALSVMFVMLPRASASAARINELLQIEPNIKNVSDTRNADARSDHKRGYVTFEDVTFSYPGAEEPVLSNISFTACPGEVTAIIGGTGSGKSTMINLIPRFYDVASGRVLVDDVDVREMSQEHLRSKIGFVPQKAVLFSGSITDNMYYGKAKAAEEEIQHALNIAQASDFVNSMDYGLKSAISQGGINLSGDQKQRLSIARAFVRRPEIYILDDSFSALDFKTEARLRIALKKEIREATVFIVAQRVSAVKNADQIIVLHDGRIAGIGTHSTLMESSEIYREIVSSQVSSEEIA